MRIDQLIPAFHRGDAIGDTAFAMKRFFLSRGYDSEIYCLDRDSGLESESRPFSSFPPPSKKDITILHYALPSPLTEGLVRVAGRKAIIYHNITPPEFFAPYSAEMARISAIGRKELASLAPVVDLALADSGYNRSELDALGYKTTDVLPLFIDFSKYDTPPNVFVRDLYRDDRTNILFVGRIAPNKKIEDLVRVAFYYKKYISPLVRLIVVGKTSSLPKYYDSVSRMTDEFYLKPEEMVFTGHIPDEELFAIYRASDVFLSLSEHEGFCLPLIESMVFDLPIVAFSTGAVPETLDGAGVLINEKRTDRTAELVAGIVRDKALREKIVAGQHKRLDRFRGRDLEGFLMEKIGGLTR